MKKKNNEFGFSMAELLMVVAILVALFGVAFVAVQRHQRSMTQLEYDTIAKEIFVAAQNHLTAAESQGYLGKITDESGYGNKSEFKDAKSSDEDDEVYFFTVTKGTVDQGVMLDLMLPFGSIDETIRAGGSYIIRYQPSTARVLDVFYSNPGPVTAWLSLKGESLSGHYSDLMALRGDDKKADRRRCSAIGGAVVGWYGDGDALPVGDRLEAPQVVIHNEETLWVAVKDTNASSTSSTLVLLVTGETSKAKKVFYLREGKVDTTRVSGEYKIVLDDITTLGTTTAGLHFADIAADTSESFIPGENITVEAVAYNNSELTNVAYSGKGRTNSLFADPSSYDVTPSADLSAAELTKINGTVVHEDDEDSSSKPIGIAAVANFRHLENLDKYVSGWGKGEALEYISAVQLTNLTDDLSWTKYIGGDTTSGDRVCAEGKSSVTGYTGTNKYWPVNLEKGFLYDGRGHSISDVVTDGSAPGDDKNVGLFRTLNGCTVRNLELIDFTVQGTETANAGALAGAISDSAGANTSVSNVLVRNSAEKDSSFSDTKNNKNNIIADASAGGLIGSMSGGAVTGCAAAVYVSGGTNAGGLIGKAVSGTVTACYSGGHTDGTYASYYTDGTVTYGTDGKPDNGIYNIVAASGEAGGLIGSAGNTAINYSYSTCSVKGNTAGGFVGSGSGIISKCYATGLVNGTTEGAFAGSYSGTASDITGCYYYEIINERKGENAAFTYLEPCSGSDSYEGITALDASAKTYNDFSLPSEDESYAWQAAVPYDTALKTYYTNKDGEPVYNLRTVAQLGATLEMDSEGNVTAIVATHYGDWPAPEIFVINTNS